MNESIIEREIVLPRRVVHQPVPFLNPEGDCGACVLAGLLGCDVRTVYDRFMGGKVSPFNWHDMPRAVRESYYAGDFDRYIEEVPTWPHEIPAALAHFGLPGDSQSIAWRRYVRMAIDAGYYGIANVSYERTGRNGPGVNHWILVCGIREHHVPSVDSSGARVDTEILVSCSSTRTPDEEWVEVNSFLRERGGFNLLLARPVR